MKETSVDARMRKARQALASGRTLLEAGDTSGACNRAYYAMFYASHAALDASGAIAPGTVFKTHNGLIAIFSKELVLTNKVDGRLGRALSKIYDLRLLADYEGDPPTETKAIWAVEQAEAFVAAVGPSSLV